MPLYPAYTNFFVQGENSITNDFLDASLNSKDYLVDYSLFINFRTVSDTITPSVDGSTSGFVSLNFIIEYSIGEKDLPDLIANDLTIFQGEVNPTLSNGNIGVNPAEDFEGRISVDFKNLESGTNVEYVGIVEGLNLPFSRELPLERVIGPSNGTSELTIDIPSSLNLKPGLYELRVLLDPDKLVEEIDEENNTVKIEFEVNPSDLEAQEVVIAQTAFDPKLPGKGVSLAYEKPFHFQVQGKASNIRNSSVQVSINLEDLIGGFDIELQRESMTVKDEGSGIGLISAYFPGPPSLPVGKYRIRVNFDTENEIGEIDELNNVGFSEAFEVVSTYPLNISFITFDDCDADFSCYGSVPIQSLDQYLGEPSVEVITKMFPVSPGNVKLDRLSYTFVGSSNKTPIDDYSEGIVEDIRDLEALLFTLPTARKIFAVVPLNYFKDYHNPLLSDAAGLTLQEGVKKTAKVAFLAEGTDYQLFPHELGHTFGSSDLEASVNGYDNIVDEELSGFNNLMSGSQIFENSIWIPKSTYEKALDIMVNSLIDPELLIVRGIYSKSADTFFNVYLEYSPEGQLDENTVDGQMHVSLFDRNDSRVDFRNLSLEKYLVIDRPGSVSDEIPLDLVPFATSFNYNKDVLYAVASVGNVSSAKTWYIDSFRDIVDMIAVESINLGNSVSGERRLDMLYSHAERGDAILSEGNNKKLKDFEKSFRSLLEAQIKNYPEKDLIIEEYQKFTSDK